MKYVVRGIAGQYALSADKGQSLYDLIFPLLLSGQVIELDFSGVKIFAATFFNVAIGQLLRHFSRDVLNLHIRITGLNADGQHILRRVMDNAEQH